MICLGSSSAEMALGVVADRKLNVSQRPMADGILDWLDYPILMRIH